MTETSPQRSLHAEQDFRLIAARQLSWDKDAWREPAYLAFVIRTLKEIAVNETESRESRAEAEMLMKKLYKAEKRPA